MVKKTTTAAVFTASRAPKQPERQEYVVEVSMPLTGEAGELRDAIEAWIRQQRYSRFHHYADIARQAGLIEYRDEEPDEIGDGYANTRLFAVPGGASVLMRRAGPSDSRAVIAHVSITRGTDTQYHDMLWSPEGYAVMAPNVEVETSGRTPFDRARLVVSGAYAVSSDVAFLQWLAVQIGQSHELQSRELQAVKK